MRTMSTISMLLLSLVLTSCDGDAVGTEGRTGTYTLRTVNANTLPVVLEQAEGAVFEVTSGSFTLKADNTWTNELSFRLTEDGVVTTESETTGGTYTLSGDAITATEVSDSENDGRVHSGTVNGNTLTLTQDGFTVVYRK